MSIQMRRLSAEEASRAFQKRGQMDLREYVEALRALRPGDAMEVDLAGLTQRAMKRRIGQAAGELGYRLRWSRENRSGSVSFLVREEKAGKGSGRGRKRAE